MHLGVYAFMQIRCLDMCAEPIAIAVLGVGCGVVFRRTLNQSTASHAIFPVQKTPNLT